MGARKNGSRLKSIGTSNLNNALSLCFILFGGSGFCSLDYLELDPSLIPSPSSILLAAWMCSLVASSRLIRGPQLTARQLLIQSDQAFYFHPFYQPSDLPSIGSNYLINGWHRVERAFSSNSRSYHPNQLYRHRSGMVICDWVVKLQAATIYWGVTKLSQHAGLINTALRTEKPAAN